MVLFTRFCGLWYGSSSLHLYTLCITYLTLADRAMKLTNLLWMSYPTFLPLETLVFTLFSLDLSNRLPTSAE